MKPTSRMPSEPASEPAWLIWAKRLFPHPLFAGTISLACSSVAILFLGVVVSLRIWPMGLASAVFFKNGPGSLKYFLTLGIAVTATIYMQVHGKKVIRRHFSGRSRQLNLTARQCVYVVMFVVGCSFYVV